MTNIGTKFNLADRFTFDPLSNSLVDKHFDDEVIRLGSNESRILLLLSQRPNEVVTRNELYDFVWREQGFEVDDSSLTQAISTLRKMLKDSTKSPLFVKTVPKRGYQFIADVKVFSEQGESVTSDETQDASGSVNEPDINTEEESNNTSVKTVVAAPEIRQPPITQRQTTEQQYAQVKPKAIKTKTDKVSKLLLFISFMLPICVALFTNPSKSEFRHLATHNDVSIDSPVNQPDLTNWLPSIELCIDKYISKYEGGYSLNKVIATGSSNDLLILNYIHKPEYSSSNVTLRIVANQDKINKVCQ